MNAKWWNATYEARLDVLGTSYVILIKYMYDIHLNAGFLKWCFRYSEFLPTSWFEQVNNISNASEETTEL